MSSVYIAAKSRGATTRDPRPGRSGSRRANGDPDPRCLARTCRADALLWEYPYGAEGQRQIAIDRAALAAHGFEVLFEDRREPSSLVRTAGGLALIGGGRDEGSIRILYGRPTHV